VNKQVRYQHINFIEIESKAKTSVWSCRNNRSNIELGQVQWYGPWRQYCFYTYGHDVVFNAGCLKDIQNFLNNLMQERRVSNE